MLQVFSEETGVFLRKSINYVMSEREKSGNTRQDLIDTLITLRNEDKGMAQNAKSNIGRLELLITKYHVTHLTFKSFRVMF